jgi:hypothetical protein
MLTAARVDRLAWLSNPSSCCCSSYYSSSSRLSDPQPYPPLGRIGGGRAVRFHFTCRRAGWIRTRIRLRIEGRASFRRRDRNIVHTRGRVWRRKQLAGTDDDYWSWQACPTWPPTSRPGPRRRKPDRLGHDAEPLRFSSSNFMRVIAFGSARGISISISRSFFWLLAYRS